MLFRHLSLVILKDGKALLDIWGSDFIIINFSKIFFLHWKLKFLNYYFPQKIRDWIITPLKKNKFSRSQDQPIYTTSINTSTLSKLHKVCQEVRIWCIWRAKKNRKWSVNFVSIVKLEILKKQKHFFQPTKDRKDKQTGINLGSHVLAILC